MREYTSIFFCPKLNPMLIYTLGIIFHRIKVPVLNLEYRNPDIGMHQDKVGTQAIEMRLDVYLPFGVKILVEEFKNLPFAWRQFLS